MQYSLICTKFWRKTTRYSEEIFTLFGFEVQQELFIISEQLFYSNTACPDLVTNTTQLQQSGFVADTLIIFLCLEVSTQLLYSVLVQLCSVMSILKNDFIVTFCVFLFYITLRAFHFFSLLTSVVGYTIHKYYFRRAEQTALAK